jgi:hypothetical protein
MSNVRRPKMFRLLPISVVYVCVPLSLLLLGMWLIYAGAVLFTGDFQRTLTEGYEAVVVKANPGLAFHVGRVLVGTFGGLVGWVSLAALLSYSRRPWSRVPKAVKVGCFVGILSAVALPTAPGLALPPILLCGSLIWLAVRRDA